MRRGLVLICLWMLGVSGRAQDGKVSGPGPARGARWSEGSEVVLVPKRLLSDAFQPSLTIGNLETLDFVVEFLGEVVLNGNTPMKHSSLII